MYWVEWKTLYARPARKSLDDRYPATGLRVNPVFSEICSPPCIASCFSLQCIYCILCINTLQKFIWRLTFEKVGNVLQLWNVIWAVTIVNSKIPKC